MEEFSALAATGSGWRGQEERLREHSQEGAGQWRGPRDAVVGPQGDILRLADGMHEGAGEKVKVR